MKLKKENMDTFLEVPGAKLRLVSWGGMSIAYSSLAEGTDFTPAFKGLKDDMCQCPHWGYVLKGALVINYSDGTEEVIEAGDVWYMPPGHTGRVDGDTEVLEFSPEKEQAEEFNHIKKQMGL